MKQFSALLIGLLLGLGRQMYRMGGGLLAARYARGGIFSFLMLGTVPLATAAWTTPPPGTATTGQNISLAFYYYPSWATTASIWAQAPGSSTWTQIGGGGGGGNGGSLSGSGSITVTAAGTWYFMATEGATPNGTVVAGSSGTTVSAASHPPTFGLSYPSYLLTNQSFTMGIGASDVDGDLHSMGIRWQGMGLVGGPWMISGSGASATTGTLTAPSSAGSINVRGEVWDNAGNGVTGSWESIPVYVGASFSFGTVTYNGSLQTVPVTASPSGATYTLSGNYQQTNAGTYSATATANGSYRGSYTGNWTIAKADQSISFGSLSNKTYGDPPFGVSASANSGLAVSFSVVGGPASISGSTVTLTGTGTVTIRASQGGNSNYNAATSVDRSFVVSAPLPPAPVITSASSASGTVGVSFSYQITASNSPTSYSASALPAGLSITSGTGAITGTPTVAGTTNLTIGATNSGGTGTAPLTITVLAPPSITSQPVGGNVNVGQSFTFTVSASGSAPLSYQWKKDGSTISGATSSSYTIGSAQTSHAGSYTVVVSNAAGSVTSSSASLTVTAAPSITSQPQSQTVNPGTLVSFSVTATGGGTLSYQWQKNGSNISGATSSSYQISSAQSGDAGNYTVIVSNAAGSTTSNVAVLAINAAPSITAQPQSQTVNAGTAASFSVTASGTAPLSYQWRKDGNNLAGATGASYTISATQATDAGAYSAVVTNPVGSTTSASATLTVNALPVITAQPQNQTVVLGGTATFTVTATGTPAPTYQWRKNGTNLSGATNASLVLTNVQASDAATYTVVVTNSVGSVTSSGATLTVSANGNDTANQNELNVHLP